MAHRTFEYLPLHDNQFRILHLQPRRTDRILRGELVHHSLLEPPAYQTLSYCWGSSEKQATINISGCELAITQNLHDALRTLESWHNVAVWADGVCINQDDTSEKASQVRQMAAIFTGVPVTVWLGHYDKQAPFSQLQTIFSRYLPINPFLCTLLEVEYAEHKDIVRSLVRQQAVEEVMHVLCAPWFQRMWVCQEIILADKIIVKYGQYTLSWWGLSQVSAGLHVFYYRESIDRNLSHMFMLAVASERAIKRRPKVWHIAHLHSRLLRLLLLAKAQRCSNLLDHWYGFQALLGYDTPISIDYSRSITDLFTDVTLYCLKTGSLDVLELVERRTTRSDLPSWVLNLSEDKYIPFDCLHFCTGGRYMTRPQSMDHIRCDRKTLLLPMYVVDYVASTTPCYEDGFGPSHEELDVEAMFGLYRSKVGQAQDLQGYYITGGTMREAFWRTLCYDNDGYGCAMDASWKDNFDVYHVFMTSDFHEDAEFSGDVVAMMMKFSDRARADSFRCFFRSRTGYIGWAPRLARSGYMIAVIPGARVPYIFEVGQHGLHMIGHAYVHGLMNRMIVDGHTAELTAVGRQLIAGSLQILPVV